MNSNKFEQQILQAVLEIAQERITDTPHQFPPDFEARLVKKEGVSAQTIKAAATESVPLYKAGLSKHIRKPKHDIKTTKFLAWGGLAASILIAVTVTTLLRPEQIETEQSTLIPIEALDSENAVSIVTTEPAVTLNPEMASEAHQPAEQTTMALTAAKQVSGTTAVVNAQTMTVTGAENITKSEKANVAVPQDSTESAHIDTEPAPKKNEAREIIGDIDLDGKFTLVDRAWAELIFFASTNIWGDFHELVPLTEEQLRQCDLIPDESQQIYNPSYDYFHEKPLQDDEINAIIKTADLIYEYRLVSNLDVKTYLENQAYYDSLAAEMEAAKPKPWENTAIDWTVLGLPECPTEEDYRSILDYQYIIDHAENKDQLTVNELSNIQTTYVKHYHQYQEMLDAEQIASEISTEQMYQMGDVNRDGKIDLKDIQWALKEYTAVQIGKYPLGTVLDDEQRSLAMVADRNKLKGNAEYAQDHVVIQDVYILLSYYTFYLGAEDGEKLDVAEFSEKYWYPYVHDNQ